VIRRRLTAAAIVALTPVLAGCSVADGGTAPVAGTSAAAETTTTAAAAPAGATSSVAAKVAAAVAAKVAAADRTHEVPTPAPAQRVAGGWRKPEQAVYVFATRYINWNAEDVSAQLRTLARVSVGQARSAMLQAASGTASDYELKQGGVANSGQVESIAPVAGAHDEYAVVTRERTTATNTDEYQGLAPEWHLALATVTRTRSGLWVLSDWQPES
jgi:hypothetical protein